MAINWDSVVSAVATNEGLVVTERRSDGTLGAPFKIPPAQFYSTVTRPCPPGQTWDPVTDKCRTFRVIDEAGRHVNYMVVAHPCLPGSVWDPSTGKCVEGVLQYRGGPGGGILR